MSKKRKIVRHVEKVGDEVIINLDADEANLDWIRAARLMVKAEEGDKEAEKELERRMNTPVEEIEIDDI